jgi:hypothetical protein
MNIEKGGTNIQYFDLPLGFFQLPLSGPANNSQVPQIKIEIVFNMYRGKPARVSGPSQLCHLQVHQHPARALLLSQPQIHLRAGRNAQFLTLEKQQRLQAIIL